MLALAAALLIVLGSVVGVLTGLVLNSAFRAIDRALKQALANLATTAPEPLVPNQVSEAVLFLVDTVFAVAGALTDIEELAANLSFATAFLSFAGTALFQNPLHIFPLLLMLALRYLARATS